MDADERLKRLLADSSVPARDFGFQAAVMERVARRRLLFSLLALLPWAVLSAVLLWLAAPHLGEPAAAPSSVTGVAASVLVLVWAARRLARADLSAWARLPSRMLTPRL
ncbi:hypothetical protein [Brevundimonas sp.]|uniref:hypothetical protein n=1 Tax=Brevundimonas sp. TaxID=1871086 RepID=UPI0025F70775|nr:hypothetical protein [Brevundimonas sp.]